MKKRIMALMISAVLSISLLPYEVFANLQSPVERIERTAFIGHTIGNPNKGEEIKPVVELKFTPAPISEREDGLAEDGELPHEVTHYRVHFNEYDKPNDKKMAPKEPLKKEDIAANNEIKVQKYTEELKNGMLYKMTIVPYHRHRYKVADAPDQYRWAPHTESIPNHPFKYVLTDFDTKVEGRSNSLEVTWENPGYDGMEYEIGYAQGSHESLAEMEISSVDNNIHYVSSRDIIEGAVPGKDATGRDVFTYKITENIEPGKRYSVFVRSKTTAVPGDEEILQNYNDPKIVTSSTEIGLEVFNIGAEKIRLEWNEGILQLLDGKTDKLERTEIREYEVGKDSHTVIATLYKQEGANIGYYEYKEPKVSAEYQLVFIFKDTNDQPKTARVLYVPGELRRKPTTPQIPKPLGENTEITDETRWKFLLPGDDALDGVPNEEMWQSDHTFHPNMGTPSTLNLVWSAYKEDRSLLYDIWVTDDIGMVTAKVDPIIEDLSFSKDKDSDPEGGILYDKSEEQILGFRHTLTHYYNSDRERLALLPNKVYYIKIVAKKRYGSEFEPSLPLIVTVMFNSEGEVFAPPMISKPPLKAEAGIPGTTAITIKWLQVWNEIMAKRPLEYPEDEQKKAKEWQAKVYTKDPDLAQTTGPAISFIKKPGLVEQILTPEAIKPLRAIKDYTKDYAERTVKLGGDIKYEYKFMPYQDILNQLEDHNATAKEVKTVEEYIEMLMSDENEPGQDYGWKPDITIAKEDDELGVEWSSYTQNNLEENTSYVFFIRPYTYDYDGTKLQASLPTWVVATTLPDGEMPERTPTVPSLFFKEKGDTHISVKWEYSHDLDYEIVYSRFEDPETAIAWPYEISTDSANQAYVEDGAEAVVRIDGLFPETIYNIWVRAKQKKGLLVSAWSNPVTRKTNKLEAPTSPGGLGVASYNSILEAGKDFKAVDSNHITVEWERNAADKDLDNISQDGQRVSKEYKYVIEIADNPEFIDKQGVTVSKESVGTTVENAEILSRSMVYFGKLIANRPYYIRAKTILIAKDPENDREIVKESTYTEQIRIITKPSQEEYDGGDKVNEVIYPNKIEETYDGTTWTYEIKDTQKVINEMVTGNQFKYVIPVQKYRDRYDAKIRVIKIPQPIVTTLLNRRMTIEIRTNILSIEIPAKALDAYMVGTTADGMVEFVFETLSGSDLYGTGLGYEYGFLSTPERMSISLKGQKGIKSLSTVDALLQVRIKIPNQTDYANRNLGGYTYDTFAGIWTKGNHHVDKINSQIEYTTGAIGTYAVYEKTRVATYNEVMTQSMRNVVKKYDIVGLGTNYTPYMNVSGAEYANIMLGIAEKKSQIKPSVGPTTQELNRAKSAGLYISQTSSNLTQEAAISGIVRLYELTHGISIRPQTKENVSAVWQDYQANIQKAYTLGLIYDINPKQAITYEELFSLIEQVIE